ncbi:MAG: DUF2029 domain-containing protein [Acidobacteriota bacterium]|nr:DUF2029 domain-containing protein [Acidobacteriota bacterium]
MPSVLGQIAPPIRLFFYLSMALTLFSAFMNLVAPLFGIPRSSEWPFGKTTDPFRDFYLYKPRYAFFHSPRFFTFQDWPFLYPAPLAVVSKLFYSLPHSTRVYLLTMIAGYLIAALLVVRALVRRRFRPSTAAILMLLVFATTNMYIICYQQANLEFIVWLTMSLALWAYFTGRGYAAAVLIGIAASMKLYPLIFIGLLLSTRKYRETLVAFATAVLSTLVSLWLVCPDLRTSIRGIQSGLALFRTTYVLEYQPNLRYDHSLFALLKSFALSLHGHLRASAGHPSPHTVGRALSIYLPCMALAGILLYVTSIRRLPLINQVLCFSVAIVLLPPVSYDYTLLHLYAVLVLLIFVSHEPQPTSTRALNTAFAALALLLSPPPGLFVFHHQAISGPIKCLALITLFVVALRYPVRSSFDRMLPARQDPIPAVA